MFIVIFVDTLFKILVYNFCAGPLSFLLSKCLTTADPNDLRSYVTNPAPSILFCFINFEIFLRGVRRGGGGRGKLYPPPATKSL